MAKSEKVQLNLLINKAIRIQLQRIAAQLTLDNPEKNHSAVGVAAEILEQQLKSLKEDRTT